MELARPDLCDLAEVKEEEEAGQYNDDLKDEVLDLASARAARAEELQVFRERRVYEVVERSKLLRRAKVLGVRWVEDNKVRSMLVCQEFNFGNDPNGDMFVPTPPLGATRLLLFGVAS